MFLHLTACLRQLVFSRQAAILIAAVVFTVAAPLAQARNGGSRRHPRLRALAHAFASAALPSVGLLPEDEEGLPADGTQYELKLDRSHTGEMIDVVYRIGDTYIPEALDRLNHFLRDSHNEEESNYDPRAFDVLHTMLVKLGRADGMVDILSGYRSQETNDMLRASGTTNAAEHSQHIVAKAMDIRVPGVPAKRLRDAALSIGAGGVGYYPAGQFVHIDVGPVRQWTFTPHTGRRHSHGRRRLHRS